MRQIRTTAQGFCDVCGVTVPVGWWCWIVEAPAGDELIACTCTCREVAEIEPEARCVEVELDMFDCDMSSETRHIYFKLVQDWLDLRNRLGGIAYELEPAGEVW